MRPAGFDAGDREYQQGLNIVNAAIKTEVQHFIWSYVLLGGSINLDLVIISFNRTSERNKEYRIPYYEAKSVVAFVAMAVFVSETKFQSGCSGLSSHNATELYIVIPFILLLSAYVPLCLIVHLLIDPT